MRIALLTPYGGTNLGDMAIQTAAIKGIRSSIPEAEIWGITLHPERTRRLHGIPCFSMMGLRIKYYSESLFVSPDSTVSAIHQATAGTGTNPTLRAIWLSVRKIPVLGNLLQLLRRLFRLLQDIIRELRHLKASFTFMRSVGMVIIAGGGQLDDEWGGLWGHPYALLRWAALAKLAGSKVAVTSVGLGKLGRLSRIFVITALRIACYRSYRDAESKAAFHRYAFTRDDPCVPDLAFGLRCPHNSRLPARPHGVVVGVSPIAFGHSTNWPTSAPDVYAAYVSKLVRFVVNLRSRGCQIYFFATSGSDQGVVTEIMRRLAQDLPGELDGIEACQTATLAELLPRIDLADIIIASRLHGTILSHLREKPVVAISFDRKVNSHMENVEQSEYVLDIARFTEDELALAFNSALRRSAQIKATLRNHVDRYQAPLLTQYRLLAYLARGGRDTQQSVGHP
jgi:polysaccharide pyruvyl transferase WcaK-like protein